MKREKGKKPRIRKRSWHKKPTFGSLYTVKGSPHIYISMYYFRRRLRFPTDKIDTEENWEELRDFMGDVGKKIKRKTFTFADSFYWLDPETKKLFTELEGKEFTPESVIPLFGEYATGWEERKLKTFTPQKRTNYKCALKRFRPYFNDYPVDKITTKSLEDFIDTLQKRDLTPLTFKRVKNIMGPMHTIWLSAYNEYNWNLRDPFLTLQEKYKEIQGKLERLKALRHFNKIQEENPRATFLFAEWQKLISNVAPQYHIVMELLIRGMIGSELEGLLKEDIKDDYIYVCHKVYHEHVKQLSVENGITIEKKEKILHFEFKLKNWYRERQIPMSGRLKELVVGAMARSKNKDFIQFKDISIEADKFLLTMEDGSPFWYKDFVRLVWYIAMSEAGIPRRVPYACRHTFVQWALVIGITKTRLVDIMGHADKSMIDRVYGNYRDGLVDEREQILDYFGESFLSLEELKVAFPHRYAARLAAEASRVQAEKASEDAAKSLKGLCPNQFLYPDNYPK